MWTQPPLVTIPGSSSVHVWPMRVVTKDAPRAEIVPVVPTNEAQLRALKVALDHERRLQRQQTLLAPLREWGALLRLAFLIIVIVASIGFLAKFAPTVDTVKLAAVVLGAIGVGGGGRWAVQWWRQRRLNGNGGGERDEGRGEP
jgi:hypothetical protein